MKHARPAPPTLERRFSPVANLRTVDAEQGIFAATVLNYDVLDDYGTEFAPGCARDTLAANMPVICWSHDWAEPLGRWIDAEDHPDRLDLLGQFDLDMIPGTDMPAVPRAHQAYSQLKSKTIRQFSIGFMPWGDDETTDGLIRVDGHIRFTRIRLDEVSLVIAGAVPGTKVLAVRGRDAGSRVFLLPTLKRDPQAVVTAADATDILLRLYKGEVDLADALAEVKSIAVLVDDDTPDDPAGADNADAGTQGEPDAGVSPGADGPPAVTTATGDAGEQGTGADADAATAGSPAADQDGEVVAVLTVDDDGFGEWHDLPDALLDSIDQL